MVINFLLLLAAKQSWEKSKLNLKLTAKKKFSIFLAIMLDLL
jgi:hypothetical protein